MGAGTKRLEEPAKELKEREFRVARSTSEAVFARVRDLPGVKAGPISAPLDSRRHDLNLGRSWRERGTMMNQSLRMTCPASKYNENVNEMGMMYVPYATRFSEIALTQDRARCYLSKPVDLVIGVSDEDVDG